MLSKNLSTVMKLVHSLLFSPFVSPHHNLTPHSHKPREKCNYFAFLFALLALTFPFCLPFGLSVCLSRCSISFQFSQAVWPFELAFDAFALFLTAFALLMFLLLS
jgi:hypothetical protein